MGEVLRTRFETDMVVFGFSFLRGDFNARGADGLGAQSVSGSPEYGWEQFFQQAGKPRFLLDLRNVRSPAAARFLTEQRTLWLVGATWNGVHAANRWTIALPRAFDVMIYIEDATASHLLPF